MKVLVTGGHLTPALAVIEQLQKRHHKIVYIARKSSFAAETTKSVESQIVSDLGIRVHEIDAVKLQRQLSLTNLLSLFKLPVILWYAYQILKKEKPDVLLSFGSYVAVPFALAAWLLKIPIVSHEQTIVVGLSNRIISWFAEKIAISWSDSASYFPKEKVVFTGNPLRQDLFKIKRDHIKDMIFVTGGNQGSHIINEMVFELLPSLLEKYEVVHQTGSSEQFKDYEKAAALKSNLDKKLSDKYQHAKFFTTAELVPILETCSLMISRSGANTVTEAAALGIPAIFIPIPWSTHNEQYRNAKLLERGGSAIIIEQPHLSGRTLLDAITVLTHNYQEFEKAALKNKALVDPSAASKIADLVEQLGHGDLV